jgi:hypothetical protein
VWFELFEPHRHLLDFPPAAACDGPPGTAPNGGDSSADGFFPASAEQCAMLGFNATTDDVSAPAVRALGGDASSDAIGTIPVDKSSQVKSSPIPVDSAVVGGAAEVSPAPWTPVAADIDWASDAHISFSAQQLEHYRMMRAARELRE